MTCDHAHVVMVDEDTWQCRECGAEMDSLDLALLRDLQQQETEQIERESAGDQKYHRFSEDQAA
jgi:ribosomal protein L37AE/L43A